VEEKVYVLYFFFEMDVHNITHHVFSFTWW
jgi:hypothetical protein